MQVVRSKLQKWGNSYGIRITKADAELLGWSLGDEVSVPMEARRPRKDLSHWKTFHLGGNATDHDDGFEEL